MRKDGQGRYTAQVHYLDAALIKDRAAHSSSTLPPHTRGLARAYMRRKK
jgi:hypothetical protein